MLRQAKKAVATISQSTRVVEFYEGPANGDSGNALPVSRLHAGSRTVGVDHKTIALRTAGHD
jgi:hypothetical protein